MFLGSPAGGGAWHSPEHPAQRGCAAPASAPTPSPRLFSAHRIQATAAVPSAHLRITRIYCRSTLPLSFPRPHTPVATPHPFKCEDLFIFNHRQIRHTSRAPALLAATSPGTSPLPIYSIWC